MQFRRKVELALLVILALLAFASYHDNTGSTAWLQFTTLWIIVSFVYVFDVSFTNESDFIFDPDADNWRRKTETLSG